MNIRFIGVGSAFTTMDYYHSNMLITSDNGKKMLIDCGADARFSLSECQISDKNPAFLIDAVYISHLHSDHIGGLEWLAITTYFAQDVKKPKLFMEASTMEQLWNDSLKGGLGLTDKVMSLDDYFTCVPLQENGSFEWEGITFNLIKSLHISAGVKKVYSYALLINPTGLQDSNNTIFISTDTQFRSDTIIRIASKASVIFHDCETSVFKTGVHTHYDDLLTLPEHVRSKIWLYHYQPDYTQKPEEDGFKGFVAKGQEFKI